MGANVKKSSRRDQKTQCSECRKNMSKIVQYTQTKKRGIKSAEGDGEKAGKKYLPC
jgi:hypothetical protein